MSELLDRWRGKTWQALLTREPYGLHFSASARGRPPTDDEVAQARATRIDLGGLVEVTEPWSRLSQVNPYVRHYASAEHLRLMTQMADAQSN